MQPSQDELESLWDALLSRQAGRIIQAYNLLEETDKIAVLLHLERMSSEAGWHPEQVISANAALEVLKKKE